MITPRQTTLIRAPDLRAFRRAIADAVVSAGRPSRCAVVVPTEAAANLLRATADWAAQADVVTRDGLYALLHDRTGAPQLLGSFERDVLMRRAAITAAKQGAVPPFRLRPGLVAEMLSLYDELHRRGRTLDAFERLMLDALEASAESDRGAARMLAQTHFLLAAFQAYEAAVAATRRLDEGGFREFVLSSDAIAPLDRIVVTLADRAAEPHGLWPADFDLLARLPGLERLDVVATETVLASGFHQRLLDLLPGSDERIVAAAPEPSVLRIPRSGDRRLFVARDREEELADAARLAKGRVRSGELGSLDRFAVLFQRPLPYLYLARHVFADARMAWQATDELPLAGEPFAAVLDLVLTFVTSGFTRAAGVALLRSPHLRADVDGEAVTPRDAAALDRALLDTRFVGGVDRLHTIAGKLHGPAARAARAMLASARELSSIAGAPTASAQLSGLASFLRTHEPAVDGDHPLRDRHARARTAILGALDALSAAHAAHDDAPLEVEELAGTLRRWIDGQTFSPQAGSRGVRLVDAHAARYGAFDEIRIVGLVEADWPERPGQNIFYPPALLNQLGWTPDPDRQAGARAAFRDLLRLAAKRTSVSAFTLEDDAIVAVSSFVEELDAPELTAEREPESALRRMFVHEALAEAPLADTVVTGPAAEWLAARRSRTPASDRRYRGFAGAQTPTGYAVNAVEQYLACPFKYFAATVLDLEEEKDEEPGLTRLERGQFVHDVLCEFFTAWQRAGRGAITLDSLPLAIEEFTRIAESRLATLPETERALERTYLLGSAASAGLVWRAFAFELERDAPVVERLLEHRLEGTFTFGSGERARQVRLRGKADRIDLLPDRRLRVVDYKLRKAPNPKRALQLPIYAVAATQSLMATRGGAWNLSEAGYVAFGERQSFVRLGGRQGDAGRVAEAVEAGETLFLTTLEAIERGEFPVQPEEPYRCRFCAYPSVCRKDYVGDE